MADLYCKSAFLSLSSNKENYVVSAAVVEQLKKQNAYDRLTSMTAAERRGAIIEDMWDAQQSEGEE